MGVCAPAVAVPLLRHTPRHTHTLKGVSSGATSPCYSSKTPQKRFHWGEKWHFNTQGKKMREREEDASGNDASRQCRDSALIFPSKKDREEKENVQRRHHDCALLCSTADTLRCSTRRCRRCHGWCLRWQNPENERSHWRFDWVLRFPELTANVREGASLCTSSASVCVCVCVNSTFPSSTVQSTRAHARRTHVTDKTPVGGSTWPGPVSIATGRTAISVGKKDRRKQEKVKRKKI